MKHSLKITLFLVGLFLVAQVVGLFVINQYIDKKTTAETGVVTYQPLPYSMERPAFSSDWWTVVYIVVGVLIGTVLALLLIKFKQNNLWKLWFFLAILFCLGIALSAFINPVIAGISALILALFRILKPNVIVNNITEMFIYAGIAAVFVPIPQFGIIAVVVLLVIISVYDIIAVWHTKHMVSMAKSQMKNKMFAGISIGYTEKPKQKIVHTQVPKTIKSSKSANKKPSGSSRTAVLGGGDIAFPLLFAGVIAKTYGLALAFIIPVFAAIALLYLLIKAEKGKFYPAMPFISAGCFVGYGVVFLLNYFIS